MRKIINKILSIPSVRRMGRKPFIFVLAVKDRINYRFEMLGYLILVYITKNVYFGSYHFAGQTAHRRQPVMKRLIEQETASLKNNGSYNILEIGSWAGQSAVLWATLLKQLGLKGQVLCVDYWNIYGEALKRYKMRNALKHDAIFKLFLHNVKHSGCSEYIKYIRGKSSEILPMLKPGYFNLIYVDGDHKYSSVKQDIDNACILVKDGGIICGDDLELQLDEVPKQVDFDEIRLGEADIKEYENIPTHLGVTVAVNDVFGRVTCNDGFWSVRKTSQGFK